MNKNKFFFVIFNFCFFVSLMNSQNTNNSQNIELPKLTTIIENENIFVTTDALPKFNEDFDIPYESGNIFPELPKIELPNEKLIPTEIIVPKKDLFFESLVGGGFPSCFVGKFTIFNDKENSPFKLNFNHNSSKSYNTKSLTENFFDNQTFLNIEKTFDFEKFNLSLNALYQADSNGLQNVTKDLNSINQNFVFAKSIFDWKINDLFLIGFLVKSSIFSSYIENSLNISSFGDFLRLNPILMFCLNPKIYGKFENSFINSELSFDYQLLNEFSKKITQNEFIPNRFETKLDFSFIKENFICFLNIAFLFGNVLNENSFLFPFETGISFSIPVNFSQKNINLAVSGGLCSVLENPQNLEKKYKFSTINFLPTESSDWFGKLKFELPIKNIFVVNSNIEFFKTAFNNQTTLPIFNENFGIYEFYRKNQTILKTEFVGNLNYELFSLSLGFHSFWLETPPLDYKQKISFSSKIQNEKSTLGLKIEGFYGFERNFSIPFINFECFAKISSSVNLIISLEDSICLFSGKTRFYNEKFITKSGSAAFLLEIKF